MNRATLSIIAVAVVFAAAGFVIGGRWYERWGPATDEPTIAVGERYHDVALPDLDGQPRRLSEWDGRPRLLNFWATWCGPCREELPMLQRVHQDRRAHGLEVIGIALDEREAVREFVAQHSVTYLQLLETPRADDASVLYGNRRGVLPFSVLIDANGTVIATKIGAFRQAELDDWVAGRGAARSPR